MLIRSFVSPVLCSVLLTLAACDKEETLGEVESETAAESESESASEGESDSDSGSGETEGESDSGINCPTDAMMCPDGSSVGRSGPDCEFDPCPGDGTDSDTGEEPPTTDCAGDVTYYEPAGCPMETQGTPYVIEPGCYSSCNPDSGECSDGSVCMVVEINPCICDDGGDCCDACGSADALCIPVITGEACDPVPGDYLSLEEYECGITKDGIAMCQWQVQLSESGVYNWLYSDVGEGGNYACKDGVITLDNSPDHSATYDPETAILTWDGIEYAHAP